MKDIVTERRSFFGDSNFDFELPAVNQAFWSALIGHMEGDLDARPRVILDVGCHTGGLLLALCERFAPEKLFGIEPIAAARFEASRRLGATTASVTLFDSSDWHLIPTGTADVITSHEMLYMEPDVKDFMKRVRRVLAPDGVAYVVLGCHSENPLWKTWKGSMVAAGHRVYDHIPIEIMEAASSVGLLPSVQPLRRSGWVTYDPIRARFKYPNMQAMFDHHYRYKLIFRFHAADNDRTCAS